MNTIVSYLDNIYKCSFGVFITLMLVGCTDYFEKDADDFEWSGSIAINVGSITYTVSELFEEITDENIRIEENDENVTTFLYIQGI